MAAMTMATIRSTVMKVLADGMDNSSTYASIPFTDRTFWLGPSEPVVLAGPDPKLVLI